MSEPSKVPKQVYVLAFLPRIYYFYSPANGLDTVPTPKVGTPSYITRNRDRSAKRTNKRQLACRRAIDRAAEKERGALSLRLYIQRSRMGPPLHHSIYSTYDLVTERHAPIRTPRRRVWAIDLLPPTRAPPPCRHAAACPCRACKCASPRRYPNWLARTVRRLAVDGDQTTDRRVSNSTS